MPSAARSDDATDADPLFISAVARGMQVLRAVADSPSPVTVSDVARLTGFTQSNVWRICYTMQKLGYLASDKDGFFRPGLPLLALGHAALSADRIDSLAQPILGELADRVNGVTGLGILEGLSVLYLNRWEDSKAMLSMKLRPGSTVPLLTSAMGWAYLAAAGDEERGSLLGQVKRADAAAFARFKPLFDKEFSRFGDQGFMINAGIFHKDVAFAATALSHPKTGVRYVMNCGGLSTSLTVTVLRRQIGPQLRDIAAQLQRALGAPT